MEGAGKHFDPLLADLFFESREKFKKVE